MPYELLTKFDHTLVYPGALIIVHILHYLSYHMEHLPFFEAIIFLRRLQCVEMVIAVLLELSNLVSRNLVLSLPSPNSGILLCFS